MQPLPPPTAGETTARVVSILVLVLTLGVAGAIVLLVEGPGTASPTPTGAVGGPGEGSGPDSDTGATTVRPTAPFPLPRGAQQAYADYDTPGQTFYTVRGRLPRIKAFYDRALPAAGYEWRNPTPAVSSATGRPSAWSGPFVAGDGSSGWLGLDSTSGAVTAPPGTIVIAIRR